MTASSFVAGVVEKYFIKRIEIEGKEQLSSLSHLLKIICFSIHGWKVNLLKSNVKPSQEII